ncbi:uncharacterized protein Z520_00065 [Fonsecaea multimorphosa CBS 102226]|uniref:VOC domain-containing protein n=1 Tax=Fonsecaea multimorphosa CBS 102226 TaxID=1442371 RepID=A0A0D2L2V9_9EURO|nr:uncharacterized protein Z520_00065 [Fonsecaea multimorphosa CBS 102226]KIY03374.1 hypothetical protein Z520_00065 [Fonsecaea multimorphosa CBS 102226]OAL33024.1 hypothetical protein AYO22_00109 [Fonsecaea multimorphosa]
MGSLPAVVDFDAPSDRVLSPSVLAHVVLRTQKFQEMRDFYTTFLGGHVTHGNDFICFITYDHEHHRIALIQTPDTGPKVPTSSGLHHIAFTFDDLQTLLLSYRQRKARGIVPTWGVNHGTTISLYYKDPDGNLLETQVDCFDTAAEATEYMMSKEFAENPIGADFDPEDLIDRIRKGEPEADLKRRANVGPRTRPNLD